MIPDGTSPLVNVDVVGLTLEPGGPTVLLAPSDGLNEGDDCHVVSLLAVTAREETYAVEVEKVKGTVVPLVVTQPKVG